MEHEERSGVLISLGAGSVDRTGIHSFVSDLIERNIIVYLDGKLYQQLGKVFQNSNVLPFDFTSHSFSKLRLVLGRPGIGLITDCVRFGIPMVAFCANGNSEILHNGEIISALAIGRHTDNIEEAIETSLEFYFDKVIWKRFHENVLSIETNGHAKAAEYLLEN
ncbi:hypothetical protein EHQ05_16395 [Leptospira yasudae]|uniref:hypothetical protein n=1 Tax=Leptospira yasudae TaxID=2202201 RepID=UPI0010834FA7|nr:hypothetical protein [Leptospira yasudae]TGK24493.1 hypothetical protein EHQ05_16395 [Leptospira yasudae]TGM05721.1 hypothetical protein EHQ86_09830 [Leptospira yasudae]